MPMRFLNKFLIIIFIILLMATFTGCEKYISDAYEQEDFSISAIDAHAASLMPDSTFFLSDSLIALEDSSSILIVPDTLGIIDTLTTNYLSFTSDALIDNTLKIDLSATGYGYLLLSHTGGNVVFFFDDNNHMAVWKVEGNEEGDPVDFVNDTISMETIAAFPKIKRRYTYNLNGDYLIMISQTERSMSLTTFHAVVLTE